MDQSLCSTRRHCEPWNKGKLVGQKAPLRLKEIWAIRIRFQLAERVRELALFNLAVDSKLRSCDLVKLRVNDVTRGDRVAARAIVMQQKTGRPVQFEITEQTRESVAAWIGHAKLRLEDFAISQSPARVSSSFDASVHPNCARMAQSNRTQSGSLWHPYAAPHQGNIDLSEDEES